MAKSLPECTGSYVKVDRSDVDPDGYAVCAVCGNRRKVNDKYVIRKHGGRAKGPTQSELRTPVESEPVLSDTPTKETIVERPQFRPEHPPSKEIGFILNVAQTDTDDLETAIKRIRDSLTDLDHVKMVTFTHGKYYYEGRFYSSAEWKELTGGN